MARRKAKTQRRFRLHALSLHPYCRWCQCPLTRDTATADHLVPLSRGGSNDWANLCLACLGCNQSRQNKLPGECSSPPVPLRRLQAARAELRIWLAWTRYAGGRWRRTFRGTNPDGLLQKAQALVGKTGETVILHDGQEPTDAIAFDAFASAVDSM
jgi:hypothetical protein